MKKIISMILAGILALATVGCAPGGRPGGTQEGVPEGGEHKEVALETVPVEIESLKKETVSEKVYAFGYLEANDTYTVTPYGSGGVVDEILVSVGDIVEEGTILYKLETEDIALAEDKDLLQKQSSMKTNQSTLNVRKLSLEQSKGDLEIKKLNLDTAKDNYEKNLELFNSGIASQSELDNASNAYEQAKTNYDASKISYESAQVNYNSAQVSYSDSVQNYNLSVADYDERYADTLVKAPITGLVTDVSVQKDITSSKGSVTIIEHDKMLLNVSVMEKYIRQIAVGQKVDLEIEYMDKTIIGEVTDISLVASKGFYPVEITIDNAEHQLTPGMYAESYIYISEGQESFVVNKTSILSDNDGDYIYIVDESGEHVERIDVTLGIEDGNRVEISGNISAGDELIVTGQDYVVMGQPITKQ